MPKTIFAGGAFTRIQDAASDTVPDAFDTFTDQFNVATSTVRTSNSVTPAGYDTGSPISVSGGEYDLDNAGAWTSTPGTINPGQTVRLRHTSSGSASTTVTTTVTIGGVAATFESTTASAGGSGNTGPIATLIQRRRLLN